MKNFIRVFSIFVAIASLMALTMCKRLPKTPKQTGIGKGNDTLVANINDTLPIKVDSLGGLQITAFAATFDHALLSSPNGKAQLQIPTVNACTESRLAKRELALSLDMGEDFELGADAAIKSKVLLKVELQDANNALLNTPKWNVELQTDQGRPEEQLRIDFDNIPSNATKVLVSIQPQGYTPPADPKAQAKIRLRAWVIQDLRISTNKTGQAPQKWLVPKEINVTRYPPIFAWTSRCPTLPNYELQLLRLHNRIPANVGMPFGTNPRVISTSIDWSDALSIETSSPRTTFQLFPAEGTGYYIYRVRPIGNYHEGGIANPLNWGMWCGEAPTGNTVVVNPALDLQFANIFFFEDPADGKNRQYNRRFHEGDQSRTAVFEQMTIADGNRRVLQTQTRLESTSDVLVKQHVYDHLGRESFVSMGAPAKNARGMDYLPGVLTHDAGGNKAYSAQNFDTQAKRANPDKVTGIVSNYYDNHPSAGISATEGYPFSLTSYFNEPQQRPFEKSGPGSAMRPGSGKGINYSFAPAKEAELVRVFGDEAPIASRVYTVTTSSPDGVSHVAYYEGEQLIATCLMDGGATPFAAINERGMDPFTQSDTLRGNNNAARMEAHSLTLKLAQNVRFLYQLKPATYAEACSQICEGCALTAEIVVRDKKTNAVKDRKVLVIPQPTCGTTASDFGQRWALDLPPGEYQVEKRLFGTPPAVGTEPQPENKVKGWAQAFESSLISKLNLIRSFLTTGQLSKLYARLQTDRYAKTPDGKAYLVPVDNCLKIKVPILACDLPACPSGYDLEAYAATNPLFKREMLVGYTSVGSLNAKAAALAAGGLKCEEIWGCWRAIVASIESLVALQADAADNQFQNWSWPNVAQRPAPYVVDLPKAWLLCLGKETSTPQAKCLPKQSDPVAFANCIKANSPAGVTVSETDVLGLKARMEAECTSACDSRRPAIIEEILASFIDKGYRVFARGQWRDRQGNTITSEQINCMAEGIIADCKAGCGLTVTKSGQNITGVQPLDSARFRGALTKPMQFSVDSLCPRGYRKIDAGSRQVPGISAAKIAEMNAALDEFRQGNPMPTAFSILPYVSNGCSTSVMTARWFDYDNKSPFSQPARQFFRLRGCQLIFHTESALGATEQVICNNICAAQSCGDICYRFTTLKSPTPVPAFTLLDCEDQIARDILRDIDSQIMAYKTATMQAIRDSYQANCKAGITDFLAYNWSESKYHYTLYYHDRAGRLVKTVPPEGVDYLDPNAELVRTRKKHPNHTYVSEYEYNSLGQMVRQRNPDGGQTKFVYDNAGRMRFSQDDFQASRGEYSFIKYDEIGRVIEGGVTKEGIGNYAAQADLATFPSRFQAAEWSRTVYTEPATLTNGLGRPQRFLLNRVSFVQNSDQSLTAYSYDPHGNVEWIHYQMEGLTAKTLEFSYDLLSGKVTEYVLNGNSTNPQERFRQRIVYDAENRPVKVMSSADGILWENDAKYRYFAHGPIERIEIGEDKLQGLDYAYALNGSLKAMNTFNLSALADPGKDGGNGFGADAFGFQIDYYSKDFVKGGGIYAPLAIADKKDYYGGMIAAIASETQPLAEMERTQVAERYCYDRVGRLTETKMHNRTGPGTFVETPDFATSYQYDGNGNLKTLNRTMGAGVPMDALTYHYEKLVDGKPTNRLEYLDDAVTTPVFTGDLEDQAIKNYAYDQRGRLTRDVVSGIQSIEWTASNKPRRITKSNGTTIEYRYDAQGLRLSKTLTPAGGVAQKQFYLHGPNGNVIAIYKPSEQALELPLGIDGKLGNYSPPATNPGAGRNTAPEMKFAWRQLGTRQYALSDHLGNVRATINDIKEPTASGFKATLIGATNYYAYGMAMPGQTASSGYRYGYNGMERDNDVLGEGNEYTTEFRQYDARVGRWMSLDPEMMKFASWSPYCFAADAPTMLTDPNGDEPEPARKIIATHNYNLTYDIMAPNTPDSRVKTKFVQGKLEVEEDWSEYRKVGTVVYMVEVNLVQTGTGEDIQQHYEYGIVRPEVTYREQGYLITANGAVRPGPVDDLGSPTSSLDVVISVTNGDQSVANTTKRDDMQGTNSMHSNGTTGNVGGSVGIFSVGLSHTILDGTGTAEATTTGTAKTVTEAQVGRSQAMIETLRLNTGCKPFDFNTICDPFGGGYYVEDARRASFQDYRVRGNSTRTINLHRTIDK